MARYNINNTLAGTQQNLGTAYKTIIGINAATASLRRGRMWSLSMGIDGAPNATDCAVVYDISRMTAAGTGTAATPTSPEGTAVASDAVGTVNYTAEPTVTAASSLYTFSINQRAPWMWQALDKDETIVWPATNLAGLVCRAKSPTFASTVVMNATFEDI